MDIVAAAAHELRTPITSIAGYTATLRANRHRLTETEIDEALVILDRQTHRLAATLDQLLDLTQYEHLPSPRFAVELADVVADAVESAPPPAGVTVSVAGAPDGAPLVVSSERLAMTRVLINLLTNAYNYGGPNVAISSHNGTSDVTLTVEDDGTGIAPKLVPTLFAPFIRGGATGRPHPPGAGLGLALARTIVESFDGQLTYTSRHPNGSCFTVTLPATTLHVSAEART